MNLITPGIWNYELSWGITPSPYLCTYKPSNVTISNKIEMKVRKESGIGWYRDKDWNLHQVMTDYTGGFLISKESFLYGKFRFKCNLPSWRGAWPAVWLIDTSGKMGVPPEIDIFESMQKNCLSRNKSTCSYHDLPDNHQNYSKEFVKSVRHSQGDHVFELIWEPGMLRFYADNSCTMVVTKDQVKRFPDCPMNLIVDLTIGDWGTRDHEELFVIKELEYVN
jgi:beta-glucanase (GH16 family)